MNYNFTELYNTITHTIYHHNKCCKGCNNIFNRWSRFLYQAPCCCKLPFDIAKAINELKKRSNPEQEMVRVLEGLKEGNIETSCACKEGEIAEIIYEERIDEKIADIKRGLNDESI